MALTVFLSAVSKEFHESDPENPRGFTSYRDFLKEALRRLGRNYNVIVQEELAQGRGDLLQTLDNEIYNCSCIVHLVGRMAGALPEPASTRRMRERHSTFLSHEPELAKALSEATTVSYTQWELYLAFHYGMDRFVYFAKDVAPRSPKCQLLEIEPSQAEHVARVKLTGEHRDDFEDQRDLALKVVTSIVRCGLVPGPHDSNPTPEAIESARTDSQGLVEQIANAIRNPDLIAAALQDETGVDQFLHALDTATLKRELDRRTALEIVHQRQEQLRVASPSAKQRYKLAFAEFALGHYSEAMVAAQESATMAATEPDGQENALNACLLWHDIAVAAGRREEALVALEKGGALIDKERDPLLWADFHEQVAEFLLDHARFDHAEPLIDDIIDIREEHQPDETALAKSLLLWCHLLDHKANFKGAVDVSARAEHVFTKQISPDFAGISASLDFRGVALS
ncbi:MAG: hypothetical protein KDA87_23090, partial [Planctomycetales bacterium]|nr:hypothetical protein [Planctomycetales bacterium]